MSGRQVTVLKPQAVKVLGSPPAVAGATTYLLRKLESVRLVTDTGEGGQAARMARGDGLSFLTNSAFRDDEDAAAALDWLQRNYVRQFAERGEHCSGPAGTVRLERAVFGSLPRVM